jgi:MoxR-like ATPase
VKNEDGIPDAEAERDELRAKLALAETDATIANDALELAVREANQKLIELAEAAGVPWQGKTHEETVTLVRELCARLARIVDAWDEFHTWAGGDSPNRRAKLQAAIDVARVPK